MQESDHQSRLEFARLTGTLTILQELWTFIEPTLPGILDKFYEHVAKVPHLAAMLKGHIDRLKGLQRTHWSRLFQGTFDEDYVRGVYTIGQVHSRIGLEPRWFIAGYQFILSELSESIVRHRHGKALAEATRAILGAVMLDIDLVISAYLDAVNATRQRQLVEVAQGISSEIQQGIDGFQGFVLDQSASVTQTSATAEEIVKNLGQLNALIEDQSSNVAETSASVEEVMANIVSVNGIVAQMGEAFGSMSQATGDGKAKVAAVVKAIQELVEESKSLQRANETIKEIAAKTNLLAMNAAIEAAHAGKTGAGFAVVSDEIRKLASQAGTQSKDIGHNVHQMDVSIHACDEAARNAFASFEAILSQYGQLEERSQKIVDSMAEQTEGSRQILEATGEMNRITAEVKNQSFQMLEGGKTIQQEMGKVLEQSEQVRCKTADLIAKVGTITDTVVKAHERV